MKQLFNQIFFLKKSKSKEVNLSTVYLRITVDGTRTEISTNRKCDPKKWSAQTGRLSGKTEEVRTFNAYLDAMEHRVYDIHKDLVARNVPITGELIKEKYLGKAERQRFLIEIYQYHNDQFAALVGKDYALGTLKKYKTALASLQSFIQWKYGKNDIALNVLNYQFVTDYEFYLKSVCGQKHNTAMGIIKKLKKVVRQCVANEWVERDPFMNYKVKTVETNRAYLLQEEIEGMTNKYIEVERLDLVRDLFLFSCFTGLSYSDVAKLSARDLVTGIDGEKWIFIKRTKTDDPSRLPLLPVAQEIIAKYSDHPKVVNKEKLLPVISNQRLNTYLKELADVCGIHKELTYHCARHTFATTVTLSNGVPIETVCKMLGHKNLRTTQIYVYTPL